MKKNNTRLGCIGVTVIFVLMLAYLESIGSIHLLPGEPTQRPAQPTATRTANPSLLNRATVEAGSTFEIPLGEVLRAQEGITSVDVVSIQGTSIYLELTVEEGANTLEFAQVLRTLAVDEYAADEFSAILWDGNVAVSYLWIDRRGEWNVTELSITPLPPLQSGGG